MLERRFSRVDPEPEDAEILAAARGMMNAYIEAFVGRTDMIVTNEALNAAFCGFYAGAKWAQARQRQGENDAKTAQG